MKEQIKNEKEREKIIDFMKKEWITSPLLKTMRIQKIESENLTKKIMLNQRSREINFKLLCL